MTFASTEAAATDIDFESPLTIVSQGILIPRGTRLPSIKAKSGFTLNPSIARFIARYVASNIFTVSISSSVPYATL